MTNETDEKKPPITIVENGIMYRAYPMDTIPADYGMDQDGKLINPRFEIKLPLVDGHTMAELRAELEQSRVSVPWTPIEVIDDTEPNQAKSALGSPQTDEHHEP